MTLEPDSICRHNTRISRIYRHTFRSASPSSPGMPGYRYNPESRIKRTLFVWHPFLVPSLFSHSKILLLVSAFLIFPVLLRPIMPFGKRVFQIICLALACLLHFNVYVLLKCVHVKNRGCQARF